MAFLALVVAAKFAGGGDNGIAKDEITKQLVQYSEYSADIRNTVGKFTELITEISTFNGGIVDKVMPFISKNDQRAGLLSALKTHMMAFEKLKETTASRAKSPIDRCNAVLADLEALAALYKARDAAVAKEDHYNKKLEALRGRRLNLSSTQTALDKIERNEGKKDRVAAEANNLREQVTQRSTATLAKRADEGALLITSLVQCIVFYFQQAAQIATAAAGVVSQLEAICTTNLRQQQSSTHVGGYCNAALSGSVGYGTAGYSALPLPSATTVAPSVRTPHLTTPTYSSGAAGSTYAANSAMRRPTQSLKSKVSLGTRSKMFFAEKFSKLRLNRLNNNRLTPVRRSASAAPSSPFPIEAPSPRPPITNGPRPLFPSSASVRPALKTSRSFGAESTPPSFPDASPSTQRGIAEGAGGGGIIDAAVALSPLFRSSPNANSPQSRSSPDDPFDENAPGSKDKIAGASPPFTISGYPPAGTNTFMSKPAAPLTRPVPANTTTAKLHPRRPTSLNANVPSRGALAKSSIATPTTLPNTGLEKVAAVKTKFRRANKDMQKTPSPAFPDDEPKSMTRSQSQMNQTPPGRARTKRNDSRLQEIRSPNQNTDPPVKPQSCQQQQFAADDLISGKQRVKGGLRNGRQLEEGLEAERTRPKGKNKAKTASTSHTQQKVDLTSKPPVLLPCPSDSDSFEVKATAEHKTKVGFKAPDITSSKALLALPSSEEELSVTDTDSASTESYSTDSNKGNPVPLSNLGKEGAVLTAQGSIKSPSSSSDSDSCYDITENIPGRFWEQFGETETATN